MKKSFRTPVSLVLALAVFAAGCGDGTKSAFLGVDAPTSVPRALDARGQMEFALERYNRDKSPENLAALRQAKADYAMDRLARSEGSRATVPVIARSNALVDQGWTGGTTEWTYAWQGAQNIPNARTTLVSMDVAGHGAILDTDLEIADLRHNWTKDLIIHLFSPAGTSVRLFYANPFAWNVEGLTTNPFPAVDLVGTYFDDEAAINISYWDGGALGPFTGSFQPFGAYTFQDGQPKPPSYPLSLVDGQDMFGTWTLQLEDIEAPDAGTLNSWRLVLTLSGRALPAAGQGVAYAATPTGIGTDGSYTWSIGSGSLPAGLTLDGATGRISGTPTALGSSTFTIVGVPRGNTGVTASASMTLDVNPPLQAVVPDPLPTGTVGGAYPVTQFNATGGVAPYAWAAQGLPAGLTLSAGGALSGVPTAAGTNSFTATVTSADGQTATVTRSVTVMYPPLAVTTPSPVVAVAYQAFSQTLQATGGSGGYAWSLTGTLPTGLALVGNTISGTAGGPEETTVTLTVTSADGQTASKQVVVRVSDPNDPVQIQTPAALPGGITLQPYSLELAASGGDRVFTWSQVGGALPPGLTLSPAGLLSGVAVLAGDYAFTLHVQAGSGGSDERAFTLSVTDPGLSITTTTVPNGVWGVAYSTTLAATGGTGAYAWSTVGGSLPGGLTLGSDGKLSGTPNAPGPFTFTVRVTSAAQTADATFTVSVSYPALTITTSALPPGGTGDPYPSVTLKATGGNNQYVWSLASGSLPGGLTLTPAGVISGTPTTAGNYKFTVQAQSGVGAYVLTATRQLAISIVLQVPETAADCQNGGFTRFRFDTEAQCIRFVDTGMDSRENEFPPLVLQDTSVPAGLTKTAYGHTFTASGGADNLASGRSWSSADLPGWLALDGRTGTISGTPLIAGDYAFGVTVTSIIDTLAATVDQTVSRDFTLSVAWSGAPVGNACTSWALYGFYTQAQCQRFVDTGLDSRKGEFPDPTITTTTIPGASIGAPYTATFAATGGSDNPGSTYTWAGVGLPAGLTLDPATGVLSGMPAEGGTFAFSVTVTSDDPSIGYHVTSTPVPFSLIVATRLDPNTVEDCKKGGWETYGFRNQGQCVAFVNTGRDSR